MCWLDEVMDSSYSQDDIRTLGFELLKVNALDEKVQGIECLVKTIKTFTPDIFTHWSVFLLLLLHC